MPVEARAYPRPLPDSDWLGKLTEEILEPDLPIVDPHHHLWDHPGSRYLLDELLADVNSGHNIVATVFIQCGSGYRTSGPEEMRPIGESEFVRAIAEESDRRGGKTKICAGMLVFGSLDQEMTPVAGHFNCGHSPPRAKTSRLPTWLAAVTRPSTSIRSIIRAARL